MHVSVGQGRVWLLLAQGQVLVGTWGSTLTIIIQQRPRQLDSALRALLLACGLELRHARFRASRANV